MNDITLSLKTAKMIKQLGRKKVCHFHWGYSNKVSKFIVRKTFPTSVTSCYAPTAQEILDELPTVIEVGRIEYMLTMTKKSALYLDVDIGDNCHTRATVIMFDGENLVEALALLRIRCKDNGYLSS